MGIRQRVGEAADANQVGPSDHQLGSNPLVFELRERIARSGALDLRHRLRPLARHHRVLECSTGRPSGRSGAGPREMRLACATLAPPLFALIRAASLPTHDRGPQRSRRPDQAWQYRVGHGQLVLGSTKEGGHPTRVALAFMNIQATKVATLIRVNSIATMGPASAAQLAAVGANSRHAHSHLPCRSTQP
jgi:hypothetical protein